MSARLAAIKVLQTQAARFPDMPPAAPDLEGLDERDARLAIAIHRTTLQRWLTLRRLLEAVLRRRLPAMEPPLQAVLLAGAAQLVFMERLPPPRRGR